MKDLFRWTYQDEQQRSTEAKIARNSLVFAMVVVVANGLIATHHMWASPIRQALCEILLVSWWYQIQVIWRGAYFTRKTQENASVIASLMGFVVLMEGWLVWQVLAHPSSVWSDGKMGSDGSALLMGAFYLTLIPVGFIRYRLDRRAENAPDED